MRDPESNKICTSPISRRASFLNVMDSRGLPVRLLDLFLRYVVKHFLFRHDSRHRSAVPTHLLLQCVRTVLRSQTPVISRPFTPIGNMESPIHSDQNIEPDHEHLDTEVEDIEAGFALIPRRIVGRPWRQVTCADTEPGTEAEEESSGEKNIHFGAVPPRSEFVHTCLAGDNDTGKNDGNWQESHHGEQRAAVQLKVVSDLSLARIEGVEGEDGEGDEDDESGNEDGV